MKYEKSLRIDLLRVVMPKSIVALFLTFLCVLISTASLLFAQTPLRDLRVGNKFIYEYNYQGGSQFARPPIIRIAIEEVISDTIIRGNRYAKIFNSANTSFRYERSSDTAIHIWNGTGENLSYNWMVKASESLYTSALGHYSSAHVFRVESVSTSVSTMGDTNILQSLVILPNPTPLYGGVTMQKALGVRSISVSYYGTAPSQAFSYSVSLRGAILGEKVWGDTSRFMVNLRIPPLTRGFVGDTIKVPVYFDGYNPKFSIAGAAYCNLHFDAKVLKLVDSPRLQITTSGDTAKLGNFPVKPDSTGLLHTFQFVVLDNPLSSTTINIIGFKTYLDDNPYQFSFTFGFFQKRLPISIPISLSTISTKVPIGSSTRIPITFTGIRQLAVNGITTASTSLSFNASLLEPLEQTPRGTVQNGQRTIPITFSWASQPIISDSITLTFPFRASLGNAASTPLRLDSLRITTTKADIRLTQTLLSGDLTLRGINQAGDSPALFFSRPTKMQFVNLAPNPANDAAHISYSLDVASMVEVKVYTMNGKALFGTTLGIKPQGAHTFSLPTHALPSGSYNAVILVDGMSQGYAFFKIVH